MSAEELSAIQKGTTALYLVGGALYKDPNGMSHETEFCYFFIGSEIATFHICTEHNLIR